MWQQEHFNHYGRAYIEGLVVHDHRRQYALFPVIWGSLQTGRCQVD